MHCIIYICCSKDLFHKAGTATVALIVTWLLTYPNVLQDSPEKTISVKILRINNNVIE
jgi:hypothetical protein